MHERTKQLRDLMAAKKYKCRDVARLLERKETTVKIWRMAEGERVIPSDALKLLKIAAQVN